MTIIIIFAVLVTLATVCTASHMGENEGICQYTYDGEENEK